MELEINEITQGEYVFLFGDLHWLAWLAWLALEIGISRDSLACDMITLEAPFCRLKAGTGENAMLVVFAKDLITSILLHPPKRIAEQRHTRLTPGGDAIRLRF